MVVKRRYADYLDGGEASPPDTKPRRDGPLPSRAWFERADDPAGGAWAMTVEHEMEFATNHRGEFTDLVRLAVDAGVTEYYVWSPVAGDFARFTADTVREPR